MPLLPGPAEYFDLEQFDLTPEGPEFEGLVLENAQTLDLLDQAIVASQTPARAAGFEIQDEVIDTHTHLDAAAAELTSQADPQQQPALDVGEPLEAGDGLFNAALAEFPPEAWQPLTPEHQIPEDPNPVDIVSFPGDGSGLT